jgi:hypothetical protein
MVFISLRKTSLKSTGLPGKENIYAKYCIPIPWKPETWHM